MSAAPTSKLLFLQQELGSIRVRTVAPVDRMEWKGNGRKRLRHLLGLTPRFPLYSEAAIGDVG